jgi:hypothetical protein
MNKYKEHQEKIRKSIENSLYAPDIDYTKDISKGRYIDNRQNRKLGRVGQEYGGKEEKEEKKEVSIRNERFNKEDKFVYDEGKWKQKVGGELVGIGENRQKDIEAAYMGKTKESVDKTWLEHAPKKGERFKHNVYGEVTVVSVKKNTGDKAEKMPYLVEFKPKFGEKQEQGIGGFKISTGEKKTEGIPKELSEFVDIAKKSKDGKDFIKRSREIKGVDPKVSQLFFDKYGKKGGKDLSMQEAAQNFVDVAKKEKPKKEESKDSSGGRTGDPIVNKKVSKIAKDIGMTPNRLGKDYKKEMGKAAVSALTDANFHDEARKLVSILENNPKLARDPSKEYKNMEFGSPKYKEWVKTTAWGSEYMKPSQFADDLGRSAARAAEWVGKDAVDGIAYTLKMNGALDMAKKIQSVFK